MLGLGLGLLALGPGIRRGFLLSYDMLFVPKEPFNAALPGQGPPRGVPSDLVIAAASRVLPADLVQKVVLLGIFVLACAGAAALLEDLLGDLLGDLLHNRPLLAILAGGAFYAWNPYVAERLIIGHWPQLLGYAGLPWVFRAAIKQDLVTRRGAASLVLAMLPAIIGGVAAMIITALVLVPVAAFSRSAARAATTLGILAAGSLPWLIPSLLHSFTADPASVAAFAARPDTPFGSVGSLLMLGGIWNADTVPRVYGGWWSALWLTLSLIAIAGFLGMSGARSRPGWAPLCTGACAGLLIACVGVTAPGRALLRDAISASAGFAVFRDAQQFIAPLALAEAIGFGMAVAWAMRAEPARDPAGRAEPARDPAGRPARDPAGRAFGVIALVAPVLLLPGLAWGAAGRLRPAWYPSSWLAAAREIDASRQTGDVLVLPWATYRTPAWNHGEVIIDPWFHLLSRPVIWNDGTQVGSVKLKPDDPRAQALSAAIDGTAPLTATLTATLTAAGIRFVIDDADKPDKPDLPGATVLSAIPGLTVYMLPGSGPSPGSGSGSAK